MPKIIVKCPYSKAGGRREFEHRENAVSYIATRDGVEKIPSPRANWHSTKSQQELIAQILREFPDAKESLEYEDYLANPNRENASEFITITLEQHIDKIGDREKYLDYIANRPRVEKFDTHGLFTGSDELLVLEQVAQEVAEHSGNVWTPIISLRREDAAAFGFEGATEWKALLSSKATEIADNLKIHPDHLKWYAAFHMDKDHPHTHLLYWDKKQGVRKAWIAPETSNAIRRDLLKYIFAEEFEQLYQEKNDACSALDSVDKTFFTENFEPLLQMGKDEYRRLLNELKATDPNLCAGSLPYSKISDKRYLEIVADICRLCEAVPKTGRLSYQLMPEEIKRRIDEITMKILHSNTDCKREFDRYINAAMEIAKMNTSNSDIIQNAGEKAYVQMKTKIGNKILNTVKGLNRQSHLYDYQERREQYQRQAVANLIGEVFTLLSRSGEQQQARMEQGGDLSQQAKKELAQKLQSRGAGWDR